MQYFNLADRTIIQLRFGPMVHCSKWYEDKVCTHVAYLILTPLCINTIIMLCLSLLCIQRIARYLERDIKRTLARYVNQNCSCGFQLAQITRGEFSCRKQQDGYVIYR